MDASVAVLTNSENVCSGDGGGADGTSTFVSDSVLMVKNARSWNEAKRKVSAIPSSRLTSHEVEELKELKENVRKARVTQYMNSKFMA